MACDKRSCHYHGKCKDSQEEIEDGLVARFWLLLVLILSTVGDWSYEMREVAVGRYYGAVLKDLGWRDE